MDYLNHLYEFVDGTIDSHSEQQLFYELANNEELRTELKQQIAVTNAVRTDFRAFNPSAESTIRIFSELGMGSALAGTMATTASLASKGKLLTLFSKYAQGIFSFLATATLAVVAYFMLDFNHGSDISNNNLINLNSNKPNKNSQNIPISSSFSNEKLQIDTTIKTEIIYKDRIIYKNEDTYVQNLKSNYNKKINDLHKIIENLKSENQNKIISISEEIKSEYKSAYQSLYLSQELPKVKERFVYERVILPKQNNNATTINLNEPLNQISQSLNSAINNELGENIGISIETSWAQYFSEYNEAVNPAQYQDFNNFRIGVLYDLDEEFSIGLDYRRENFYQIYNFVDNNGDPYQFEQKPNFNTLNGSIRYSPIYLELDNFSPFIQLGLGGNEGGTVGRLMLGTEYKITGNYKFILAGDYNSLSFRNNKIQYTSNKIGLHMGIGFDF